MQESAAIEPVAQAEPPRTITGRVVTEPGTLKYLDEKFKDTGMPTRVTLRDLYDEGKLEELDYAALEKRIMDGVTSGKTTVIGRREGKLVILEGEEADKILNAKSKEDALSMPIDPYETRGHRTSGGLHRFSASTARIGAAAMGAMSALALSAAEAGVAYDSPGYIERGTLETPREQLTRIRAMKIGVCEPKDQKKGKRGLRRARAKGRGK
jgi:hypothetical protein